MSMMRRARARLYQLTLVAGRCRWCGCTNDHACASGCSWANAEQTLCSACVPLEHAMRTATGRRELAEFLQEADFEPSAAARPGAHDVRR